MREQSTVFEPTAWQYVEALLPAIREPLLVLDGQLAVRAMNPAFERTFGVSLEQARGRSLFELGEQRWNLPRLRKAVTAVAEGEEAVTDLNLEHDFTGTGPRIVLVNARRMPLPAPSGRGVVLVFDDVTDRRRAESELNEAIAELEERTQRLEETNRELDGFTHSVSHDLRAPLRAVDGFAKILVEEHAGSLDDDARRVLAVIGKNTQKMGQLIDDLLGFSRLGRHRLRAEPIDMTALAREVADEIVGLDPKQRVDLQIEYLPSVFGDRALLRQVWTNLISNALKYSRPREVALIRVAGRPSGSDAHYCIEDNGVGFDMKYADKLFGVFQRLHAASEFEGTGVGLALVERIVKRHGGRIWAESELGKGSKFHFMLPRSRSQ